MCVCVCVPATIIPNWCSPARRSRRTHKAPGPLSSIIIIIITIIVIIIIVIRGVHIRVYDFCAAPHFYDGRSARVYNTPPWTGKNNNNWPESRLGEELAAAATYIPTLHPRHCSPPAPLHIRIYDCNTTAIYQSILYLARELKCVYMPSSVDAALYIYTIYQL